MTWPVDHVTQCSTESAIVPSLPLIGRCEQHSLSADWSILQPRWTHVCICTCTDGHIGMNRFVH